MDDVMLYRWFITSGDEEALELLVQKHYKQIHNFVYALLKNHQDADEVTNETFFKVYNKRETITDPEKLLGWLYITARRAALDLRRSRQREVNRMPELQSTENLDGGSESAAASILAAQQAQQAENVQYLLTGLLRLLSEKDLEVVECLMDGLKPKQIAAAIGSTAKAVQKRLERMLKWLQPVAQQLDELLENLPSQEQKVMERYLDNQPIKEISEKLGISPTDVEACVKRVIRQWKKDTK